MGRVLPILVVIALTIYCTVEVAQADSWQVRYAPKWLWAVIVICIPVVGPLSWLIFGRPRAGAPGSPKGNLPPPDDDDDYLRRL